MQMAGDKHNAREERVMAKRTHRIKFICRIIAVLVMGAVVASAGGCVNNGSPYVTKQRLDNGLVIVLHGLEGPGPLNASLRDGLKDAGLPYALEIYPWFKGRLGTDYAYDKSACRKRAAEIAARIGKYRNDHPARPVYIVGHSAGGAMAVFAAEAVGPGEPIDGLIVLAPALSPKYDLTKALIASRGRMVNCYSQTDIMLASLTTIGKNLDGKQGSTAGYYGFQLPDDAGDKRKMVFKDLRQIEWSPSMASDGHPGGHLGWANRNWVRKYLGPVITHWAQEDADNAAAQSPTSSLSH